MNMPDDLAAMICRPQSTSDPMRLLVQESDNLAAMLFGEQESGKRTMTRKTECELPPSLSARKVRALPPVS